MIEKTIVENRPAIVAYLNDRLEPVDEAVATLVKVIFTDERRRHGVRGAKAG